MAMKKGTKKKRDQLFYQRIRFGILIIAIISLSIVVTMSNMKKVVPIPDNQLFEKEFYDGCNLPYEFTIVDNQISIKITGKGVCEFSNFLFYTEKFNMQKGILSLKIDSNIYYKNIFFILESDDNSYFNDFINRFDSIEFDNEETVVIGFILNNITQGDYFKVKLMIE